MKKVTQSGLNGENSNMDFNHPQVIEIAKNWSWEKYTPIKVAEIGGKFFVIDGEKRVRAACYHPEITHLPYILDESVKTMKQLKEAMKKNCSGTGF